VADLGLGAVRRPRATARGLPDRVLLRGPQLRAKPIALGPMQGLSSLKGPQQVRRGGRVVPVARKSFEDLSLASQVLLPLRDMFFSQRQMVDQYLTLHRRAFSDRGIGER
jgi:hypothetical protein